jgi:hypothetical protein
VRGGAAVRDVAVCLNGRRGGGQGMRGVHLGQARALALHRLQGARRWRVQLPLRRALLAPARPRAERSLPLPARRRGARPLSPARCPCRRFDSDFELCKECTDCPAGQFQTGATCAHATGNNPCQACPNEAPRFASYDGAYNYLYLFCSWSCAPGLAKLGSLAGGEYAPAPPRPAPPRPAPPRPVARTPRALPAAERRGARGAGHADPAVGRKVLRVRERDRVGTRGRGGRRGVRRLLCRMPRWCVLLPPAGSRRRGNPARCSVQ